MKKAKLDELFNGITQSRQKVTKITETGGTWLVSFENKKLGEINITTRKAADIAKEIKDYAYLAEVIK